MAHGSPLKDLCEEATCSICLDFFRDPVILTECGHNFCRACLTHSWGDLQGAEASCPQCRGRAQGGTLRPNLQLANFVEIAKKFLLEGKEAVVERGEEKGRICKKHQESQKFFCKEDETPVCMVCGISKEYRDHEATVAGRKERFCQKHQEPLKLFCKNDEALICVVCDRSKEHRDHETLPLEEASQEYKDIFCGFLETLKEEREKILVCKADVVKESEDLLKQTTEEKQEMVAKFRELHTFLEEQEKCLLARMEEVEKDAARKRDQHLAEVSEALSSVDSLIQEMEEKCQQPASELLQDAGSILQRYEEKKKFENPLPFPFALKWQIWDFSNLNPLLEGIMKQAKDTLDSGLQLQKADVTLDPDTAHPRIILTADWKSLTDSGERKALPNNPERFNNYPIVLGREGFTGGHHFWDVLVGSEKRWGVGVARKSVRRKEGLTLSPEEGIWEVGKCQGQYIAFRKDSNIYLSLSGEPKRVRVCLNYDGGRVAFFDADRGALIYEFSGASFSGETLLPFFYVSEKSHLKLSS